MKRKETLSGWLFASPLIVGLLLFTLVPMVCSLYWSFFDYDGLTTNNFVGFGEYAKLFTDKSMGKVVLNTVIYTFVSIPLNLILSYLLALLVNNEHHFTKLFRVLYYLPCVIPAVVSGLLWKDITDNTYGIFNQILTGMGLPKFSFFSEASTSMLSLLLMAGIDYLCIDATNTIVYYQSTETLLKLLLKYQSQGWKVPKVCFYTNSMAAGTGELIVEGTIPETISYRYNGQIWTPYVESTGITVASSAIEVKIGKTVLSGASRTPNNATSGVMMLELKRGDYYGKVAIGLDYFDASISRVYGWVIGLRAAAKAILYSLLEPTALLQDDEKKGDFGARLLYMEDFHNLPYNAVWEYLLAQKGIVSGLAMEQALKEYEKTVQMKRI